MAAPSPRSVLIGSIVAAVIIAIWGIGFNQGDVTISANVSGFKITGMFDESVICPELSCSYTVSPKIYDLTLSKEEFLPTQESVRVRRQRTAELAADLIPVPQFVPVSELDPGVNLVDYMYIIQSPNDETTVWQRDDFSDIKLTTFTDLDMPIVSWEYFPGARYAQVEFADGSATFVSIAEKRKVELPGLNEYTDWQFIGPDSVAWQSENQLLWGKIDPEGFLEAATLPINSLDHIVGYNGERAYLISQRDENGDSDGDNSLIDLLNNPTEGLETIRDTSTYVLYELDLNTGEVVRLRSLDWLREDEPVLELQYNRQDLRPFVIAETTAGQYVLTGSEVLEE